MASLSERISDQSRLETGMLLLRQYSWLLDSYLLDFFTENHVNKLQNSWKKLLESAALEDFYYLLNLSNDRQNVIFPLSLICIKLLLRKLTLPREVKNPENLSLAECSENNKVDFSQFRDRCEVVENSIAFKHPKLWNSFLKHVKPKKRYEIFKIALTAVESAKRLNVRHVVDVGSGLGHLSRVLSYGFGMDVCSIESHEQMMKQARKLDCEFETTAAKYLNWSEKNLYLRNRPVYINKTVTCNLNVNEFVRDLKEAFSACREFDEFRFGIVGLHPCGDLASVLLKIYSNCSEAVFINLVGCCYHKLTTACVPDEGSGFPMSNYCKRMDGSIISHEARALACHAIESYGQRIKSKEYDHLKVHCYRATLERIINKNWPRFKKTALGNVKSDRNFDVYCQKALKKLHLTIPPEDLNSEETKRNLSQWKNVVKYYSLRLMFAPLVETVILLDRKMYLFENGVDCRIVTIFDPAISPRNQILLSEKS